MSTYADLLVVIGNLRPGDAVEITVSWCQQNGLQLTPGMAKDWEKCIHSEYFKLKLKYLGKSSDNLHHYEKI